MLLVTLRHVQTRDNLQTADDDASRFQIFYLVGVFHSFQQVAAARIRQTVNPTFCFVQPATHVLAMNEQFFCCRNSLLPVFKQNLNKQTNTGLSWPFPSRIQSKFKALDPHYSVSLL